MKIQYCWLNPKPFLVHVTSHYCFGQPISLFNLKIIFLTFSRSECALLCRWLNLLCVFKLTEIGLEHKNSFSKSDYNISDPVRYAKKPQKHIVMQNPIFSFILMDLRQ